MMMVDVPGPTLDPATKAHLAEYKFGGVCLFRKNIESIEQLRILVRDIREVLGPDAWIAIDQEGGAVQRVLELAQAPSAMAIGATDDPKMAEAVGAAVGRGLISLGINWNFAPVLDVNTNPDNPVIGDRSFGSNPKRVAEIALAWGKGLESAGVMAAVKHFPGHGDTAIDTHLDLPLVRKGLPELEQTELFPFREAIRSGFGAIMTAHILYPELDPNHPATLSPTILQGLLRQRMGFKGVIITDALDMQAITKRYTIEAAAFTSIRAGADMILSLGTREVQATQAKALAEAIENGAIPTDQFKASLKRLEDAVTRFPGRPRPYTPEQLASDQALMQAAARYSITSFGNIQRPKPTDRVLLVSTGNPRAEGPYGESVAISTLAGKLKRIFPNLSSFVYLDTNPNMVLPKLREVIEESDFVLFATVGRSGLRDDEAELLRQGFVLGKPSLHLALWNPYHVAVLRKPALITYGFREPTLDALVEVLSGEEPRGKLPAVFPVLGRGQ